MSTPRGTSFGRLVVNPNVLVAALISVSGPPAMLLRAARAGEVAVVVSPQLLGELGRVLRRDKFRRYVTLGEVDEYLSALASLTQLTVDPPAELVQRVCRDTDDDYLVALARAAGVGIVVSGDRDLLDLELADLVFVAPREAVERLNQPEERT